MFQGQKLNENTNKILKKYPDIKNLELHKLDNISDNERSEDFNYLSLMNYNLELIKKELYQ